MNLADVLPPMIVVDNNTYIDIDCGNVTITRPAHKFRDYHRLLKPGRSVSIVPRNTDGLPRRAGVIWVELQSNAQFELLGKLPVAPSVVLRDEGRAACTALWWLDEPLEASLVPGLGRSWGEEANRRVAHALGSVKRHCDAGFLLPVRSVLRAAPVRVSAKRVVGGLPAAPVGSSWRRERREEPGVVEGLRAARARLEAEAA